MFNAKRRKQLTKYGLIFGILAGGLDNPEKYIRRICKIPSDIIRYIKSRRIEPTQGLFENITNSADYLRDIWFYTKDPRDPDQVYYVTRLLDKSDSKIWLCTHGLQRGDGVDRGSFELPVEKCIFGGREIALMAAVCNNDTSSVAEILGLRLHFPLKSPLAHREIQKHINKADPHGRTPLYWAARLGNSKICEFLLARGADVNKPMQVGGTPLYIAAQYGHVDCVQTLIMNGANASISTNAGACPLHVATQRGHIEITRHLLEAGLSPDEDNQGNVISPLYLASQNGHIGVVRLLLSKGGNPNLQSRLCDGATALFPAAKNGHMDVLDALLQAGGDPEISSDFGDTPLLAACDNGNLPIVNRLVKGGADVNHYNRDRITPLIICALRNYTDIAMTLLKHHAVADFKSVANDSAILWAAYNRNPTLVKAILSSGGGVDSRGASGASPLLIAIGNKDLDTVRVLIDAGADVNQVHPYAPVSPLSLARERGFRQIEDMLRVAGAFR
ncbi:hypothetical protein AAMO2058_001080800 [Amorphochlora amoebiformis]